MALGSLRALVMIAGVLLSGMPLACKQAGGSSGGNGVQFPVRIGDENDATASRKTGALKAGDGQRFAFDLQREPLLGSAGLWACWDIPAPSTPLGRAVCAGDAAKSFEVTATYVDLLCRTNPDFGVIRATTEVEPAACPAGYEVFTYAFEPSGGLELLGNR